LSEENISLESQAKTLRTALQTAEKSKEVRRFLLLFLCRSSVVFGHSKKLMKGWNFFRTGVG